MLKLPADFAADLHAVPFEDVLGVWEHVLEKLAKRWGEDGAQAALGRADRYFLLVVLLGRKDMLHPWLYARCREVERDPDGYLDLWAREHYKSTIITFGGVIQEVLNDPNLCVGIFSHTKPIARKFLLQIKREFEGNELLKRVYADVLWQNPTKEAPQWSEEKGLVLRRDGNPKESTIEAHGLVDGQPTSAHFGLLVYDDVVTLESVGTADQIAKTTEAWSLSDNLGARNKEGRIRKWHIGTRYHFADSYHTIIERKSAKPRIYPATDTGIVEGKPVFLSEQAWADKKRDLLPGVLAAQMLQNPAAGTEALFKQDWLSFMDIRPATLNVYIMCDPASSRKKGSDYTAIAVIGVDAQWNKFLLDGVYDRLRLNERWEALKSLRRTWIRMPGVQAVKCGYEKYGMQSDLEYFEMEMIRQGEAFEIVELAWPREGQNSKYDRIQRLVPDFKAKRFHMPYVGKETARQVKAKEDGQGFRVFEPVRRKDYEGKMYSLNKVFVTEYITYPFSVHDDFLDAASRLYDMDIAAPIVVDPKWLEPAVFEDGI